MSPAASSDAAPVAAQTTDRPLTALWRYAKGHRSTIRWAITHSILNKLFDLAPPALIGIAVDVVVKKQDSWLASLGVQSVMSQLILLGVLTVVIWGLESITEYWAKTRWRNLAQTIQHELRIDTYTHVQQLEMAWFSGTSTGGVMAVLNDDVNQLERFLDEGANALLQVGTTMIAVSAVFFYMSPGVAGLAMLPVPLIVWGSFLFQRRIAPRYATVRADAGRLNGHLNNNLVGIATIKAFTAEARETARISELSTAYRNSNAKAITLSSAFSPLIRMVIVVGFTATLVYGGWLATEGHMEVGVYSVLVFLTQRLLWPLTRLGATFDLFQRAMASTQRILDLLQTPVGIVSGAQSLPVVEGRQTLGVKFEAVDFAYPERDQIFGKFDLDIPAGKTVAIVGSTGSGKSTLVRLLLRLYEPSQGRVSIDDIDVRDLRFDALRGAIGWVSQGVYLFPGSVADNIAYGRPGADRAAVEAAARAAEADDFIQALPQGYDTLIGERGQRLSGGQQQRLSIARAILKDPPILILDEATSAVDNETEAAIQRSLAHISVDRTTLVIAHRLSTIRHAHRIVVLEEGCIAESGTHDALVAQNGVYARLWRVQTGEIETDDPSD